MKDAIGGVFMMEVFLVFLFVYAVFIGIAINYARAFRVKNKIIDIIEQYEGVELGSDSNLDNDVNDTINQINSYLEGIHYTVELSDKDVENRGHCNARIGYCIENTSNTDNGKYYKVTTFVRLTIPFPLLKDVDSLSYTIPITGETRKVERINAE